MYRTHKTTINIPNEVWIELSNEAKMLGVPISAIILFKLNQLKDQKKDKDLLYNLINDGNLKELIDIYKNQNIKLSE